MSWVVLLFDVASLLFKFSLSRLCIFNETVNYILFDLVYLWKDGVKHLLHMISINLELIETAKDGPIDKMCNYTNKLGHLFRLHLLEGKFNLMLVHNWFHRVDAVHRENVVSCLFGSHGFHLFEQVLFSLNLICKPFILKCIRFLGLVSGIFSLFSLDFPIIL